MNANELTITQNQLNNKLRKLKTAAVYASLNLKINWDTERPIYSKPTWNYYVQMKEKMLSWPYPYSSRRNHPEGMYTKEMNKQLNMIRSAVAYQSRGGHPVQASNIKRRKVGNSRNTN